MADQPSIAAEDIRQVQEFVRREFKAFLRPLKTPLYHYASGGAAAEIIENARLRAANVIFVAEGRELAHSLEFLHRAMADRAGNDRLLDLSGLIEDYLSRLVSYVPPDIWIATLSGQHDSVKQWRRLAPRGHGVAIGFSPSGLTRAAEAAGALLAPCCYDDEIKAGLYRRALELLERLCLKRSGRDRPALEALVRYVLRELALFGAIMRPVEMAHENEWRLILCNPTQTALGAQEIKAVSRGDYTALYLDVEIGDADAKLPISEMLIGPAIHQNLTARSFLTLLYKRGYDRTPIALSTVTNLDSMP